MKSLEHKKQPLFGPAVLCGALTLLGAAPASATAYTDLYGSITTTVSVASGYSKPTIDHTGGLKYGTASNQHFDQHLAYGQKKTSYSQSSLLYSVDPASCMKTTSCKNNGTSTATIDNVFKFYASATSTTVLGSIDVKALATFVYSNETDNLCWSDTPTATGGVQIISHKLVEYTTNGKCWGPGTDAASAQFGFEDIIFKLAGNYFEMKLYDWSDWNEQPHISFAWLDPTQVPEPASVTLLGAGLLGFGAMMIRRRKKAA